MNHELPPGDVRDRIFASALRHFSQKGYAATSLREISQDAGTTKPMIYYYFGSKDELYGSIVREILEEMAISIRGYIDAAAPALDQARAYCRRYVSHFLAHEDSIALVLREVFGLGGQPMAAFANALAARVRQPLDAVLRAGMEHGELRPSEPETCAIAITGILNMFILAHVFGGLPMNPQRPLEQVEFYLQGIALDPGDPL